MNCEKGDFALSQTILEVNQFSFGSILYLYLYLHLNIVLVVIPAMDVSLCYYYYYYLKVVLIDEDGGFSLHESSFFIFFLFFIFLFQTWNINERKKTIINASLEFCFSITDQKIIFENIKERENNKK